jgi:hypothetical protein
VKIAFYHNIGANLRNNYQYGHRFREKNESIFGFVAHLDKIWFAKDTGTLPNRKNWAVLTLMKAK